MLCYIEVFFLHCIGSIGTASFYGGAAAARPHPRAQPGEFHVIVHLTIVLLVLVISSMILTRFKNKFLFFFQFFTQVPLPLLSLFLFVVVLVLVLVVGEGRQEGLVVDVEEHVDKGLEEDLEQQ